MNKILKKILGTVYLTVILTMSACSSHPKTYKEALLKSNSQEKMLLEWSKENISMFDIINSIASKCITHHTPKEERKLKQHNIILELGKSGEINQVFMSEGTYIEHCFSYFLPQKNFSKPPIFPAFVLVSINVNYPVSDEPNGPIVERIIGSEN